MANSFALFLLTVAHGLWLTLTYESYDYDDLGLRVPDPSGFLEASGF